MVKGFALGARRTVVLKPFVHCCFLFFLFYNHCVFLPLGNPKGPRMPAPVKHEAKKTPPPIDVPALSLEELREKTDNFGSKALVGEGSYGRVYYASLNNGKAVAVKKLDVSSEADSDAEFLTQVCLDHRKGILDGYDCLM